MSRNLEVFEYEILVFIKTIKIYVLLNELEYMRHEDILDKWEQSTVLTYCVEDGWQDACKKCIEILVSKKVN